MPPTLTPTARGPTSQREQAPLPWQKPPPPMSLLLRLGPLLLACASTVAHASGSAARCCTAPGASGCPLPPPHPTLFCRCSKVKELCPLNVASFCTVTANNTNFGDTCAGKPKTLTFNYE